MPHDQYRVDPDPTTGINQQTTLGTISDASVSGDTIIIRLSSGLLTQPVTIGGPAQPAPVAGDVFTNVRGETRLLIGGGGTGLITVIDDSTPSDYTVHTNVACAPNLAPTARLVAIPQAGFAPLEVEFNGAGSSDPDPGDGVVEYTFDFGDGTPPVTKSSPEIEHTYAEAGIYHAFLQVKDTHGAVSTNIADVIIQVIPRGDFYTLLPCRLLDTRTQQDGAAPVQHGTDRVLDVVGVTACGVSPLATTVTVNITVTQTTGSGFLQVYPANLSQPPATSTLNFGANMTRSNNALVMMSSDGRIKLRPFVAASGTTHVVVDVVGFFIEEEAP